MLRELVVGSFQIAFFASYFVWNSNLGKIRAGQFQVLSPRKEESSLCLSLAIRVILETVGWDLAKSP